MVATSSKRLTRRVANRAYSIALSFFALPLIGLLAVLSPQDGAYYNIEYGFSLLAALGAVGCLGHLAAYVHRGSEHLSLACSVFGGGKPLEVRRPGSILVASADWPLLVALLFGPFFVLLAGLGGWV